LWRKGRLWDQAVPLLKIGFGTCVFFLCLTERFNALFNFAPPFLWLIVARCPGQTFSTRDTRVRAMLGLLGVIQVLYAYPVAGSQVAFVTIPMIVIGAVCTWDTVQWLRGFNPMSLAESADRWLPAPRRAIAIGTIGAVLIGGGDLVYAWNAQRTYSSFTALNLPGAAHVHIQAQRAEILRSIVDRIDSSCGTLLTEPGLFSFHFWSGKPSPAGIDHQVWMSLLDDAGQNAVVRQIAGDSRACVVYQQEVVDLWTKGIDVSQKPLVRFIRENFYTVLEGQGYRLLLRRPAR
jgi:hypothetical protein